MGRRNNLCVRLLGGICLAASAFLSAEFAGAQPPVPPELKDLIQVNIHQLIVDPASMQPVVFLADPDGERALPIWIGPCEANSLSAEMEGTKPVRPLTYDFTATLVEKLKGKVRRAVVTHAKDGIYYSALIIDREGASVEIDARPSDSIILATKVKAPIFVSAKLFNENSIPLKEAKGPEASYGLTVQELNSSLAHSFSFQSTKGALVADVRGGSQAEKDGVQRGDIFVDAGGEAVSDLTSLRNTLAKRKAPLKARVFRKGKFVSLTLNPK